jgi:cephalosporin hydroxylase
MDRVFAATTRGLIILLMTLAVGFSTTSTAESPDVAEAPDDEEMAWRRNYAEIFPSAKNPVAELTDREFAQHFAHRWFRARKFFFQNKWQGVQTLQNPLDAWITQEIIFEVKPDVIIEAGTYHGGSALLWADIMTQIRPKGRVLTIDIDDNTKQASSRPLWKRSIKFFHGSTTDPAIVRQIEPLVAGKRVLVILDTLHTRDQVLAELEIYSKFVSVGSYIIVQDLGIVVPLPGPKNPAAGVAEFLATTDDFVIDSTRERFVLTNNPGGFLKRVK